MVNILVDADAGEMVNSNRIVIRDANNFVYVFVNANAGASGNIRAYKGNQAGQPTSFTEQDAASAPDITTARENIAAAIDSTGLVHMIYFDTQTGRGAPPTSVRYSTFRTSAHATTQDVWAIVDEEIDIPTAQNNFSHNVGIAIDANDDPHVIWTEIFFSAGTPSDLIRYNNKIGGTWSTKITVNNATNDNWSGADIMIGDPLSAVGADRPIIVSSRDLSGVLGTIDISYGNALNATGFTEAPDITDAFGVGVSVHGTGFLGNNVSVAIDSNDKITIAFVEHTTKDLMVIEHLHADSWTTWQTPVDVDDSTDYEFPSIAIDGTNIFILVVDDTNSDINLWKNLGIDVGFGFWGEEVDGVDLPNVGTFNYPLVKWANYNNNSPGDLDYVFEDATGVLYNTSTGLTVPLVPFVTCKREIVLKDSSKNINSTSTEDKLIVE